MHTHPIRGKLIFPRLLLLVVLITALGRGASAQIEERLAINRGVPAANMDDLCNGRAAAVFYEVLDDALFILPSIPDLMEKRKYSTLGDVIDKLNSAYFNPTPAVRDCLPGAANFRGIAVIIAARMVRHAVPAAKVTAAERRLPIMEDMARLDEPLLGTSDVPYDELVLNQAYIQMPRCSVTRAREFYDTVEGYTNQIDRQGLVFDLSSMKRWLTEYEAWVAEHWAPFYREPCGWVLMLLHAAEFDAYTTAALRGVLEDAVDPREGQGLRAMQVFRYTDVGILRSADEEPGGETEAAPDPAVDREIQGVVDAYLNRECLRCLVAEVAPTVEPSPTPTLVPTHEPSPTPEPSPTAVPVTLELWSESGNQDSKISVTLDFTPGLYKLNVIKGWPSSHGGFARLTNIISQPTACLMHRDYDVTFPATLRMEQNCKVYATLETDLSSTYRERTRSWSLSITRESDALPPVPAADGWSEEGRGPAQRPLELSFEPGIYRISGTGEMGVKNIFMHEWSPGRCTAEDYVDVPDQIRVYSVCTIKGSLWFWDHLWDRTGKWSYSIEKLE